MKALSAWGVHEDTLEERLGDCLCIAHASGLNRFDATDSED